MNVIFAEHEGCFSIDLEAESQKEAAELVRFGLVATKELRVTSTYVARNGSVSASVVFGKRRRADGTIRVGGRR